jgi:hypothetical protein
VSTTGRDFKSAVSRFDAVGARLPAAVTRPSGEAHANSTTFAKSKAKTTATAVSKNRLRNW